MKIKPNLSIRAFFLIAVIIAPSLRAELPEEAQRLIDMRKDAIEKIDRKFIDELEKIKTTYTKRGDLPSANAVQAQIDNLTNALGKPIPVGSPQSRLVGTSWENRDVPGGSRLEFLSSGQFREVYPQKTWTGTWKAISATEADAIVSGIDGTFHYKLNNDAKTVSRPDTKFIWKLVKRPNVE